MRQGRALPARAVLVPDAGPYAVEADRVTADPAAVAADPAGERGRVVGQRAEAANARPGLPDERLVTEGHDHSWRRGLARAAHHPAAVADRGRGGRRATVKE